MASYFSVNDVNFQVGDSPAIVDISAVSRYPNNLLIQCWGAGDIRVQLSTDGGVTYGDNIRIQSGKDFRIGLRSITHVQLFHTGTDSGYQVYCE